MLRLRRETRGRHRVLPWRKTFNGKVKCLNCGHRTLTYEGFRSHYYRIHRNRVPLVSRYAERPENRPNGEKRPGLLLGLLNDLPEVVASLQEAREAYSPGAQEKRSGW